ncbi:unnamed protein product [Rotaria sordida]|uniref:ADP ribosyltransferase domain-containing protein n=1 Tax=Rotaria sordida TaxID=392033 RepID=A0A819PZ55_9BILA|nr:unnamed protein product [Rotaria sordida]
MTSFEPIVIVFGSSKSISNVNLRFPISFELAIDEASLERIITVDPQSCDTCLHRYFVILLDLITDEFFDRLQTNHHVQAIYSQNDFVNASERHKLRRIINKQWQQLSLDLTSDIVYFLTVEGEKQAKLEQILLAQVYYRQARLLKEWAMSFIKAEPCHILLIPLNSSQENLDNTYEEIQKICTKLGYLSIIIRTLDKYIPIDNVENPHLIPYNSALFNNEHPHYICELIKKLSPLRFYLYGNDYLISSEWSNLMITREIHVMEDEDNWCAFLENEPIDNEIKWNFKSMFGEKWKVNHVAPINLSDLDKNLRFQSALRRTFKTFNQRQIEVTAEIFEWYDQCIRNGYLQLEPKLTSQEEEKITKTKSETNTTVDWHAVQTTLSIHPLRPLVRKKVVSFIWLDESIDYSQEYLNRIIQPSTWHFFDNISTCILYIEDQLQEKKQIFLVVSDLIGQKLFLTYFRLMSLISFIYIYCSRLSLNIDWIKDYSQIQGIYNDSIKLGEQIKQDLHQSSQSDYINNNYLYSNSTTNQLDLQTYNETTTTSFPWIVYNQEQAHVFLAHQHTIDALLSMPHTKESCDEMIVECRRFYHDNVPALTEINTFNQSYNSNIALQWYSRSGFLYRRINQVLRSNNIDGMFKIRYFLKDLYTQLNELYRQENLCNSHQQQDIIMVYRGQHMSKAEFEYFQKIQGNIISINTFLSTTKSFQTALDFANSSMENNDMIPIMFFIKIHQFYEYVRPVANISKFSVFPDEEEVLFAMGSIFRVENIDMINTIDNIPIIYLTLMDIKELMNNNS